MRHHNGYYRLQFIMEDMFFSGTPLLEAVGSREPFVEDLRETIRNAISKALIPMRAYATQYEYFLPILNVDPAVYIRLVFSTHLTQLKQQLNAVVDTEGGHGPLPPPLEAQVR